MVHTDPPLWLPPPEKMLGGGLLGCHLLPKCLLMVLQLLPLRLLCYSPVPGVTNTFLMSELGLFCTRRCTPLQVPHLVSPLTLHGQAWLLSWKYGSGVSYQWPDFSPTAWTLLSLFCASCHLIIVLTSCVEAFSSRSSHLIVFACFRG